MKAMAHKERIKFFFVIPGILWVLIFTIFPLLYSLRLSFFQARLGQDQTFIGMGNFQGGRCLAVDVLLLSRPPRGIAEFARGTLRGSAVRYVFGVGDIPSHHLAIARARSLYCNHSPASRNAQSAGYSLQHDQWRPRRSDADILLLCVSGRTAQL